MNFWGKLAVKGVKSDMIHRASATQLTTFQGRLGQPCHSIPATFGSDELLTKVVELVLHISQRVGDSPISLHNSQDVVYVENSGQQIPVIWLVEDGGDGKWTTSASRLPFVH